MYIKCALCYHIAHNSHNMEMKMNEYRVFLRGRKEYRTIKAESVTAAKRIATKKYQNISFSKIK